LRKRLKGVSVAKRNSAAMRSNSIGNNSVSEVWCLSKPKNWNEASARYFSSVVFSLPWTEGALYYKYKRYTYVFNQQVWLRLMTPAFVLFGRLWRRVPAARGVWINFFWQVFVIYAAHLIKKSKKNHLVQFNLKIRYK